MSKGFHIRASEQGSGFVIVMTATVAPKGEVSRGLVRSDPRVRLQDYKDGLAAWLAMAPPGLRGIVFAENSGYPLVGIEKDARKANPAGIPLEFLSSDQPPPPEGLHYGYSEFLLLRHVFERSELLKKARHVVKVTGRYRFPDFAALWSSLPGGFHVAVDSKCNKPLTKDRHFFTPFALACFDQDFFRQYLWDLPERMVPAPPWTREQFIETMLYDRLASMKTEPRVILRWRRNCEPRGVGANGDNYASPGKLVREWVRAAGRVLAPGLWI